MAKVKLGILISGAGTNLQAIINACEKKKYPATIECVISNRADAAGILKAQKYGIKTYVLDDQYESREHFESELNEVLIRHDVELICITGFMYKLSPRFVKAWTETGGTRGLSYQRRWGNISSIINIHPSLLPSFSCLHAPAKALDAGVKFTGCTIHFVDAEMNSGPIIAQGVVPIKNNDTVEKLTHRIQKAEHYYYEKVIKLIAENHMKIDNGKVYLEEVMLHNFSVSYPEKMVAYDGENENHHEITIERNDTDSLSASDTTTDTNTDTGTDGEESVTK